MLLTIDHSCSMPDAYTDDLTEGIPLLLGALTEVADWQLLQVTREEGCANGGIYDEGTKGAAEALVAEMWETGIGWPTIPRTEALLELANLALDQTGAGECNEGFGRPGVPLHVLVASDEPEQSGVPWQDHLDDLGEHAPNPIVSGVLDVGGTCGEGSGGYLEAVQATGGVALDICGADWGAQMGDLVGELAGASKTFPLADPAIRGHDRGRRGRPRRRLRVRRGRRRGHPRRSAPAARDRRHRLRGPGRLPLVVTPPRRPRTPNSR